jgi:hypothetical protein
MLDASAEIQLSALTWPLPSIGSQDARLWQPSKMGNLQSNPLRRRLYWRRLLLPSPLSLSLLFMDQPMPIYCLVDYVARVSCLIVNTVLLDPDISHVRTALNSTPGHRQSLENLP